MQTLRSSTGRSVDMLVGYTAPEFAGQEVFQASRGRSCFSVRRRQTMKSRRDQAREIQTDDTSWLDLKQDRERKARACSAGSMSWQSSRSRIRIRMRHNKELKLQSLRDLRNNTECQKTTTTDSKRGQVVEPVTNSVSIHI